MAKGRFITLEGGEGAGRAPGGEPLQHRGEGWELVAEGDRSGGTGGDGGKIAQKRAVEAEQRPGGGASLAGHLRLGRLVYLYDDNGIQLDGPTGMAWSEDVLARFDAYGWQTQRVADGNDVAAIDAAIATAVADPRPSLIAVRTHIGFGSPNKQDTQKAHGAPLGPDEVRLTKTAYGWDPDLDFHEPAEALARFREAVPAGERLVAEWETRMAAYAAAAGPSRRRPPSHYAQAADALGVDRSRRSVMQGFAHVVLVGLAGAVYLVYVLEILKWRSEPVITIVRRHRGRARERVANRS